MAHWDLIVTDARLNRAEVDMFLSELPSISQGPNEFSHFLHGYRVHATGGSSGDHVGFCVASYVGLRGVFPWSTTGVAQFSATFARFQFGHDKVQTAVGP